MYKKTTAYFLFILGLVFGTQMQAMETVRKLKKKLSGEHKKNKTTSIQNNTTQAITFACIHYKKNSDTEKEIPITILALSEKIITMDGYIQLMPSTNKKFNLCPGDLCVLKVIQQEIQASVINKTDFLFSINFPIPTTK